jgi:hypothetical protein
MSMPVAVRTISEYRSAFALFVSRTREARALMAVAKPDWQAIDQALLELEKARVNYNSQRDRVAQELLSSSQDAAIVSPVSNSDRVRAIAELRWELAGKPEGRDQENWYRAEDIVRRATAA